MCGLHFAVTSALEGLRAEIAQSDPGLAFIVSHWLAVCGLQFLICGSFRYNFPLSFCFLLILRRVLSAAGGGLAPASRIYPRIPPHLTPRARGTQRAQRTAKHAKKSQFSVYRFTLVGGLRFAVCGLTDVAFFVL